MLEKRMAVRPRHLEGMAKLGEHIVLAGGLLDDEGKMKGSVLIFDLEDRAALDDYLKNEPYVAEHVWEKIEIETVNVVIVNGKKVRPCLENKSCTKQQVCVNYLYGNETV